MWMVVKLLAVLVVLLAVGLGVLWQKVFAPGPLPVLRDEWWGPGQPRNVGEAITPFKINIPDSVIADLNARLDRWQNPTKPLENAQFTYGMNTDYLTKVVKFWRKDYNWKKREAFLNSLPQFKTNIAGLNIHFIHVKPKNVPAGTKVLPLLFMHGWPGSVRELYAAIPLLTTPRKGYDFVFEVIAPSLPGYGFSDAAVRPGLGAVQVGVVMRQLMQRLGFNQFYVQGGDWGSLIATHMATLYPNIVLGVHMNMCVSMHPLTQILYTIGSIYPLLVVDEPYQDRLYPLSKTYAHLLEEMGYFHLQASKPDTVGVALRDSPVGLAAYILEKFAVWTKKDNKFLADGGIEKKFSLTDLLDNVMIYWVTDSITTSMRLYAESLAINQWSLGMEKIPANVPVACTAAPEEIAYTPRAALLLKFPQLVHYTHPPRGGHFLAFEEPEMFADDVFEGMSKVLAGQTSS
ncbi:Juvenile hormone epoxide hydrolase 1 [Frankliniella fusca]|uniref:Epoxide hydrolase n=2 Tax=Arthropoda TaxID=6656 RepID=A0AAE1LC38_9NEOP|nr:Juvenile hormone epoxide hydrolase 1 [Frankliniella fusca]